MIITGTSSSTGARVRLREQSGWSLSVPTAAVSSLFVILHHFDYVADPEIEEEWMLNLKISLEDPFYLEELATTSLAVIPP